MANQQIRAIVVVALVVSSAKADNCKATDPTKRIKATLTDLYCESPTVTYDNCRDECCKDEERNDCESLWKTKNCPADQPKIRTAKRTLATDTTFVATCCAAMPSECSTSTFTCLPGYKKKTDPYTCAFDDCDSKECCEIDYTKCLWGIGGACAQGTHQNFSKNGVATQGDDWQSNCCSTSKPCDLDCALRGGKKKNNYATRLCASNECDFYDCCSPIANSCWEASEALFPECPQNHMIPESKHSALMKPDKSDFATVCCVAKATCATFSTAVLTTTQPTTTKGPITTEQPSPTNVSGAVKQQASVIAVCISVGGYFLFGK